MSVPGGVVEFLGPPGAGKSTLHEQLLDQMRAASMAVVALDELVQRALREDAHDPITRVAASVVAPLSGAAWKRLYARSTDRLLALGRAVERHPELTREVVAANEAHNAIAGRSTVLEWMFGHLIASELAHQTIRPGELLLVDEGFCNRVISLFAVDYQPDRDDSAVRSYLRTVPVPQAVIHVRAPFETCRNRLDEKGWSERIRDEEEEVRNRFLRSATELTSLAAHEIGSRGARLIRVDGTRAPHQVAAEIRAELATR